MDEQFIVKHLGELIAGGGSLFMLLFKYRELITFAATSGKYLWKPFKYLYELGKMPFHLNEQAKKSQERIDKIESTLEELNKFVKKELTYNGGSSTRDALRRIECLMIEQEYAQNALMQDSKHGAFRCDTHGKNTWVNRTYARYLGCGVQELLGLGWKRFVKTEELKRYNEVWQAAFKDGCEYEDIVEFVNTNGHAVRFKLLVSPIVDKRGETLSYVGTVIPL